MRLRSGMVLAIEPMLTGGTDETDELADGWTVVTSDGSRAVHWEHSVAVTDDGPRILTAAGVSHADSGAIRSPVILGRRVEETAVVVVAGELRVGGRGPRAGGGAAGQAHAEGRLTLAEYDERVRAAHGAVVGSDLLPLTADLPAEAPAAPAAPSVPGRAVGAFADARRGGGLGGGLGDQPRDLGRRLGRHGRGRGTVVDLGRRTVGRRRSRSGPRRPGGPPVPRPVPGMPIRR